MSNAYDTSRASDVRSVVPAPSKGFLDSLKSLFVPETLHKHSEETTHSEDFDSVPEDLVEYEGTAPSDDYHGDSIPPIPVEIIKGKPTVDVPKAAQWFTSQHFQLRTANLTQQGATLLCSRDLRRREVTIVNHGSDFIVIASSPSVSLTAAGMGRLKAGEAITLDVVAEVWTNPNSDLTDVEVFQTFETGGTD